MRGRRATVSPGVARLFRLWSVPASPAAARRPGTPKSGTVSELGSQPGAASSPEEEETGIGATSVVRVSPSLKAIPGLGGPAVEPIYPTVYVVIYPGYAPEGIYLSTSSLQGRVLNGHRFPPSREDRQLAFPVTTVDEAVPALFIHRNRKITIQVWR